MSFARVEREGVFLKGENVGAEKISVLGAEVDLAAESLGSIAAETLGVDVG